MKKFKNGTFFRGRHRLVFLIVILFLIFLTLGIRAGIRRSTSGSAITKDVSSHIGGGRTVDSNGNLIFGAIGEIGAGKSVSPNGSRIQHSGQIPSSGMPTAITLR